MRIALRCAELVRAPCQQVPGESEAVTLSALVLRFSGDRLDTGT